MATLYPTIVPAKILKDGSHKIRIAVGHKQETRYIVTSISVKNISDLKKGQISGNPQANVKLRNLLNHYQKLLDKIDPEYYSPAQLREYLISKPGKDTTVDILRKKTISDFRENGQDSYANMYDRSIKYFLESTNGDISFQGITPDTIRKFQKYLQKKGLNDTSIGIHMSHLKALINIAKEKKIVKYEDDPFIAYVKGYTKERVLDISIDEFKKIRDSNFTEKSLCLARDIFCLSYYMAGINLIDLMSINFKKNNDSIEYIREKSKRTKIGEKKISMTVQPEAWEIINKYIDKNGKLNFGYKFSYPNFRNYITKKIQKMADKLELNKRVVYYSARKSFVQHGFELGIPLEVLEYCIGQSMKKNRPIFNYIRIMRRIADETIRKILDNVK